jgi:hypothetical protein
MYAITAVRHNELPADNNNDSQARALFHDKRHLLHKRMERWIRLQQFVYGLPDDYSYAIRATDHNGESECRALIRVGWMSWYASARGSDRQHALALSLLETSEAICRSPYKVFMHLLRRSFRRARQAFQRSRESMAEVSEELTAG